MNYLETHRQYKNLIVWNALEPQHIKSFLSLTIYIEPFSWYGICILDVADVVRSCIDDLGIVIICENQFKEYVEIYLDPWMVYG